MSDPQSLEEGWEGLDTQVLELLRFDKNLTSDHIRDAKSAARALALAAFKLGVNVRTPMGHTWNYEDDEQRRIEELGA